MSARLWLASVWMPRSMIVREIERIRSRTDAALNGLLQEYAPEAKVQDMDHIGGGPDQLRAAMARGHEQKVKALVQAVGRDRAIDLGREALYQTGVELGREARVRLNLKDTKGDLMKAARVLYRILGIEFSIVEYPDGERMKVSRCALSGHYSHETCIIMSAIDEGTVSGLNQRARMQFERHITGGSPHCIARIEFGEER